MFFKAKNLKIIEIFVETEKFINHSNSGMTTENE